MNRSKAVLLLLASCMLMRSAPSFADTCTPRGTVIAGGQAFYDHIANGEPASTACWAPVNSTFVTGQTACGQFSPTYNALQLNYASSDTQQFIIPADMTSQRFGLVFTLDFLNGHNDGFNSFAAEVRDVTSNTPLGSYYHYGDQGDIACGSIHVDFNANLTGHRIQVRFTAQKGYSDTAIRIHGIAFFQG
jgi:hypothetical protein